MLLSLHYREACCKRERGVKCVEGFWFETWTEKPQRYRMAGSRLDASGCLRRGSEAAGCTTGGVIF